MAGNSIGDVYIDVGADTSSAGDTLEKDLLEAAESAGAQAAKALQKSLEKALKPVTSALEKTLKKSLGDGTKAAADTAETALAKLSKSTKAAAQAVVAQVRDASAAVDEARAAAQKATKHLEDVRKSHEALKSSGTASSDDLRTSALNIGRASQAATRANRELETAQNSLTAAQDRSIRVARDQSSWWRRLGGDADAMSARYATAGQNFATAGQHLEKAGGTISGIGGKLTASITAPALAAAGAVGGIFAVSGWNRLSAIDDARAKLKGLKYDTGTIEEVMKNALASVKGTAFGLGDAASVAAQAVAAGIKPGVELERTLKLTADAAAVAGIDLNDMGLIFGKVAAKGKLDGEALQQLMERGVGILPQLAQVAGVATEDVAGLVSEGKIGFEEFQQAMELALGGAAGVMGAESLSAAMDNVKAATGRVGASFLDAGGQGGGFYSQLKPLMGELTGMIDDLAPKAETLGVKFGEAFANMVSGLRDAVGWWQALSPESQKTIGTLGGIVLAAGPVLGVIGGIVSAVGGVMTALAPVFTWIGTTLGSLAAAGAAGAGGLAGVVANIAKFAGPIGIVISLITTMIAASPQLREALGGAFEAILGTLGTLATTLAPILGGLVTTLVTALAPVFTTLGDVVGTLLVALTPLLEMLGPLLVPIIQMLASVLGPVITLIGSLLTPVIELLAAVLTPIIELLGALLPPIIGIVTGLLGGLVALFEALLPPIIALVTWITDLITPLIEMGAAFLGTGLETFAGWITDLLVPALEWVAEVIPVVVQWFKDLFDSGTETGQGFQDVWGAVGQFFVDTWTGITGFFQGVWDGIVGALTAAWNFVKPLFDAMAFALNEYLIPAFNAVWSVVSFVFEAISAATQILWGVLSYVFNLVVTAVRDYFAAAFTWLYNSVIKPVWDAISLVISTAWMSIQVIWNGIVSFLRDTLGPIFTWLYVNIIQPVWQGIQTAINAVYSWFTNTLVPGFQAVIAVFGAAFEWVRANVIMPVWVGIQKAIDAVYNWFMTTLVPAFTRAINMIGDAFNTMKDVVAKAWEAIKTAAMAPVKFVVESVYRDGIKKLFDGMSEKVGLSIRMPDPPTLAFASGGVLPGYTPGRDVHDFFSPTGGRLALSGGEAIMRPEFTAALGRSGINALNEAARRAGSAGVSRLLGGGNHANPRAFAGGGVWDDLGKGVGDVMDFIGGAVENVTQIFTDPAGAVDKLIREPVKALLSGIGGGDFGSIVAEVPLKAIEGIAQWAKDTIKPPTPTGVGNYTGGITLERLKPILAQFPGLAITDTYRDPAYNASVGGSPTSYHMDAANPAVDIAGPVGDMHAFAQAVRNVGGWRQILWQVAGHYDHVHVANQGGVFGDLASKRLYDSGGVLRHGDMGVNLSGKPEAVLTNDQWRLVQEMIAAGRGQNLPEYITLVDEAGAILGRMRVVAGEVIEHHDVERSRTVLNGGTSYV